MDANLKGYVRRLGSALRGLQLEAVASHLLLMRLRLRRVAFRVLY